jgi:uroporphyrin-III C-methyltransferase/precorrin-2 dehydrogenase/sirohydrochlorin ferrochelatase
MSENTPAALIQQGTTHNQRVYISTLGSLPDVVDVEDIKPPTLIIVGDVVKLHEKLEWFNSD